MKTGREIGYKSLNNYDKVACADCGEVRNVQVDKNGKPRSEVCEPCRIKRYNQGYYRC